MATLRYGLQPPDELRAYASRDTHNHVSSNSVPAFLLGRIFDFDSVTLRRRGIAMRAFGLVLRSFGLVTAAAALGLRARVAHVRALA